VSDPVAAPDRGLSSEEAARRLADEGPNAIPEERPRRLRTLLAKFWAPVPWLLEVAVVLELVLRDVLQAAIFAVLLVFNAVLADLEEQRAEGALALLRERLSVKARVERDGAWTTLPAAQLVRGDLVYLRQGDLVPADIRLVRGAVSLDQSALTGESVPVDASAGATAYSGSVVVRGEAAGIVVATGPRTYFGRTAELVSSARAPGHLQRLIFGIVRALVALDLVLVAAVVAYGLLEHLPARELVPFVLILVVASVPVALPATFTLATALGSQELARRGVLVTRLAAIEEAASMEVLCSDKTGTITENRLAVGAVAPLPPHDETDVLAAALAASDVATQDPLDVAVAAVAGARGLPPATGVVRYTPFDPATKRSEAVVRDASGAERRVAKGAPQVLAEACGLAAGALAEEVGRLASEGMRVLAVAQGPVDGPLSLLGLIGFADPPRADSARLVEELAGLGVRVVMVTGDTVETARAVAQKVGISGRVCTATTLRGPAPPGPAAPGPGAPEPVAHDGAPEDPAQPCGVYAEVLPEDKLRLVERLQQSGRAIGMTGDGVNDAPALRKAEVGVAVANATDVAKAAASLVLTEPGLENIVSGVTVSRQIHQRMLTYTLNKIAKTLQVAFFLAIGLLALGRFVTTPTLVVLLLLANDFVTMSLATDRARVGREPERWDVRSLVLTGLAVAAPLVAWSFGLWWVGTAGLGLHERAMQTLVFVWLVLSGQATVYLVRERRHFWHSRPSRWLLGSTAADVVAVVVLAWRGVLMVPIGAAPLAVAAGAAASFLVVADLVRASALSVPRRAEAGVADGASSARAAPARSRG
jgi:H+-transporting ATPase